MNNLAALVHTSHHRTEEVAGGESGAAIPATSLDSKHFDPPHWDGGDGEAKKAMNEQSPKQRRVD